MIIIIHAEELLVSGLKRNLFRSRIKRVRACLDSLRCVNRLASRRNIWECQQSWLLTDVTAAESSFKLVSLCGVFRVYGNIRNRNFPFSRFLSFPFRLDLNLFSIEANIKGNKKNYLLWKKVSLIFDEKSLSFLKIKEDDNGVTISVSNVRDFELIITSAGSFLRGLLKPSFLLRP